MKAPLFRGNSVRKISRLALVCMTAMAPALASAIPLSVTRDLDFQTTPHQSFWGPGRTSSDFQKDGHVGGDTVGISYSARASTGDVTGNYNGALRMDVESKSPTSLTLNFTGDPGGGSIDTFIGASAKADLYFHFRMFWIGTVHRDFNIFSKNYSLAIDTLFTPDLGQIVKGQSSKLTVFDGSVGTFVKAGVAANIDQDLEFGSTHIAGNLVKTLHGTSITDVDPFVMTDDSATLPLQFDSRGTWDITVTDLRLENVFTTGFDLALDPYIMLDWPGSRFDKVWDFTLAEFDIYNTPRFALSFGEVDNLMTVTVQVSEPTTLAQLLWSALLLPMVSLGARRRR